VRVWPLAILVAAGVASLSTAALGGSSIGGVQDGAAGQLGSLIERAGARLEQYYARARSVLCTETVRLQPLGFDWSPSGRGRQLVYELRVQWDPTADGDESARANVLRQLVSVDGRPPRPDADPDDTCLDPKEVSPEPLDFLLPSRQARYRFDFDGTDRVDGRAVAKIAYRSISREKPTVAWTKNCVSVDVPSQEGGRVWIDLETADVLRLDQRLVGRFDIPVPAKQQRMGGSPWMEIERADSTIRYKPVTFHNPEETLLLPFSIESLQVVRNAGTPRLRSTQRFSDYRRFMTGGRLVK
jgi:hypothetical protein